MSKSLWLWSQTLHHRAHGVKLIPFLHQALYHGLWRWNLISRFKNSKKMNKPFTFNNCNKFGYCISNFSSTLAGRRKLGDRLPGAFLQITLVHATRTGSRPPPSSDCFVLGWMLGQPLCGTGNINFCKCTPIRFVIHHRCIRMNSRAGNHGKQKLMEAMWALRCYLSDYMSTSTFNLFCCGLLYCSDSFEQADDPELKEEKRSY